MPAVVPRDASAPAGRLGAVIDERLARALHVQTIHHAQLAPEHEPHVLFQASRIGALLEGAYDGDVTFAELAEHGDLGLGTLNALEGEMVALDGRFHRADIDGRTAEIDPEARTPFAVVVPFAPTLELSLDGPLDQSALLAALDRALPEDTAACALRVDGDFELVRARSVPRQHPPYKPLTEVVADQHCAAPSSASGSPSTAGRSRSAASICTSSRTTAAEAATSSTAARAQSPRGSTPRPTCTSSYHREWTCRSPIYRRSRATR